MERTPRFVAMGIVFAALGLGAGCGKKEAPVELAPVSSASLEAPKAAAPALILLGSRLGSCSR